MPEYANEACNLLSFWHTTPDKMLIWCHFSQGERLLTRGSVHWVFGTGHCCLPFLALAQSMQHTSSRNASQWCRCPAGAGWCRLISPPVKCKVPAGRHRNTPLRLCSHCNGPRLPNRQLQAEASEFRFRSSVLRLQYLVQESQFSPVPARRQAAY
jgi:hypothetical protein